MLAYENEGLSASVWFDLTQSHSQTFEDFQHVLICAILPCISSSVLVPSKNSVMKLLNGFSSLMLSLPVLPFMSWAAFKFLESEVIAYFTSFFHLTYKVMFTLRNCVSFSCSSINALIYGLAQQTYLWRTYFGISVITKLL